MDINMRKDLEKGQYYNIYMRFEKSKWYDLLVTYTVNIPTKKQNTPEVKELFKETGMIRLQGDETFYYMHNKDGELEGMISSHLESFV